jgi:hypothetical protein
MHGGTQRHQKPFSAVHGGVMWLTLVNFGGIRRRDARTASPCSPGPASCGRFNRDWCLTLPIKVRMRVFDCATPGQRINLRANPTSTLGNERGRQLRRPTGDKMTDVPFKVGDRVKKRSGYEYPGFIVSVFTNRAGAVVEADHSAFSGMLHIFNGDQLEHR